jgi:hypothetical protein
MIVINNGGKFDLQSIASKFLNKTGFTTTDIKGEMHIPGINILGWKPFGENAAQTYQFCGPNSSLTKEDGRKQRLQYDPSDGITKEDYKYQDWSKPINEIDYQAYLHDVAYLKADKSGVSS